MSVGITLLNEYYPNKKPFRFRSWIRKESILQDELAKRYSYLQKNLTNPSPELRAKLEKNGRNLPPEARLYEELIDRAEEQLAQSKSPEEFAVYPLIMVLSSKFFLHQLAIAKTLYDILDPRHPDRTALKIGPIQATLARLEPFYDKILQAVEQIPLTLEELRQLLAGEPAPERPLPIDDLPDWSSFDFCD